MLLRCCRAALLLSLVLPLPILAAAPSNQQIDLSRQAFEAAEQKQWSRVDQLRKKLGEDYPLAPYLDFYRLRQQFNQATLQQVQSWLSAHDDTPLADKLRHHALSFYGRSGNWSALRAVSQGVPGDTGLRCYYYQALIEEDREHALQGARELWLSGQSRPDNCDALFNQLRKAGQLDDELVWQRMLLAFRANNLGLLRYLRSLIKTPAYSRRADLLVRLYQVPAETRILMPEKYDAQIALAGLHRLAEKDPVYARLLTPVMAKRYQLSDADHDAVLAKVAWYSTIRDLADNREWLDKYLLDSSSLRLLEQRTRRAVIEQDWPTLLHWIDRLPAQERNSARWRYWRARALESTQQDGADVYYSLAATERSFWGFLAAQQLSRPYPMREQSPPDSSQSLTPSQQNALARIEWLLAMNEAGMARNEWLFQLRHSDSAELVPLANAAMQRDWHHFSIETALFSGRRDVLDWRFPVALLEDFQVAGKQADIDPWLLMAVSRRESAFNPHARSHAGATGLMQLLPATAKQVASKHGKRAPQRDDLITARTNMELGALYLSGLLDRYQGNRVLALAAYNAGPHRVDKWLNTYQAPFDVFIESIPYYETREYVQAVLAYRVILMRTQRDADTVALMSPQERVGQYGPPMLAARQKP